MSVDAWRCMMRMSAGRRGLRVGEVARTTKASGSCIVKEKDGAIGAKVRRRRRK